ncbi:MAG: 4'-phosphopantetheinyl transferase superfamily protein [Clostridia bacterium]|nr:4'-phosphopantetheinyl transferase superfamily protein [Clostridia bacterium]
MVYLYYIGESLSAFEEPALLSMLPASRRTQIERRPYADRIASAAAACLLRYALCDCGYAAYADAPIVWEGKPHFADPAISVRFNLSHTVDKARGMFAAAVLLSDWGEVGVDLEFVHPIQNRAAMERRLFTPEERDYIGAVGKNDAFFDIWCAKEAFVKWTGEGFAHPLSSVSVDVTEKKAVSGEVSCDLAWYSFGESRICCAADDLSSGVQTAALTMEQIVSVR